jgi:hypothetical protein
MRSIYQEETRMEAHRAKQCLDWTLVHPAILANELAKGEQVVWVLPDLARVTASKISRADTNSFPLA